MADNYYKKKTFQKISRKHAKDFKISLKKKKTKDKNQNFTEEEEKKKYNKNLYKEQKKKLAEYRRSYCLTHEK